MKTTRNPYVVGQWVQGNNFYDRREIINELFDQRHQCIYLIGNRKMGKTSILHYIEKNAEKETSEIPLFLDLQGVSDGNPVEMGKALNSAIKKKVKNFIALWETEISNEAREVLKEHKKLSKFKIKKNTKFCVIIRSLTALAEKKKFKILLLMDEAEKLLSFGMEDLESLRAALHESRSLRTIIAASKTLGELNALPWITSPLLHGFIPKYISPFSDEEAEKLICQSKDSNEQVSVEHDILQGIINHTGNHPFLVQRLCDGLFARGEGKLRAIEQKDLVIDDFLANLFQIDYNSLSGSERRILHRLSKKEQSKKELQDGLSLLPNKLERFLHSLEQLGFIRLWNDKYQIASKIFKKWLEEEEIEETRTKVSDEIALDIAKKNIGQSIFDSKNVIAGSDIKVGGDFHLGDKDTNIGQQINNPGNITLNIFPVKNSPESSSSTKEETPEKGKIDLDNPKRMLAHKINEKPLKIFLSYSHKDEEYKEELDKHLTALKRSYKISTWDDQKISPGDEWDDVIKIQLEISDIILLLISSDFLASDYIWKVEITRAIERHKNNQAKVIPIFLRACDWGDMPFAQLQGLPKDAKPVSSFEDRDKAYTAITKGIKKVITDLRKGKR